MRKIYALFGIILFLNGCATMFSDSNDIINIRSSDKDAKILINGNEIGQGSAQYILPKGNQVTITATKQGCSDRSIQTQKRIAGITWLDILFFPAFIVDAVTGAMYKADPLDYTINPSC